MPANHTTISHADTFPSRHPLPRLSSDDTWVWHKHRTPVGVRFNLTMNYDPNLTNSGRMADQTVELTFGMWRYRKKEKVTVGGNCTGLSVIRAAVEIVFDRLPVDKFDVAILTLARGKDTLCVHDEDGRDYDWLNDTLISAKITSIKPKSK